MTFQREEYSDEFAREALPLNQAHHAETLCFEGIPLDPDYERYGLFNKTGMLRIYTAREGSVLRGYSIYFVGKSPHSRNSLQAIQDILFLDPASRRGSTGIRFIQWCDVQLRDEGVQVTYQSTTYAGKDFGAVLVRLGYAPVETMYARRLDR